MDGKFNVPFLFPGITLFQYTVLAGHACHVGFLYIHFVYISAQKARFLGLIKTSQQVEKSKIVDY